MILKDYFADRRGIGILSTADAEGRVNSALYARPTILDDGTLVLLMRERLTYRHIQANPHAVYLFIEAGDGYTGIRLYLKKIEEINNPELVRLMTRPTLSAAEDQAKGPKHLLRFTITKCLRLVGPQPVFFDDQV